MDLLWEKIPRINARVYPINYRQCGGLPHFMQDRGLKAQRNDSIMHVFLNKNVQSNLAC